VLELCLLLAVARIVGPEAMFEIGTFKGMTSRTLWENFCGPPIHTLDLDTSIAEDLLDNTGVERAQAHSMQFDFTPFYFEQSLVFIDGAHDYRTVASDTRHALKMLRTKGPAAVVWHDFSPAWPGVQAACQELIVTEGSLYHIEDTSLCVYLRGIK